MSIDRIDAIIDKCGKRVVLIGQDMDNDFRKVLKVDGTRCIDLRNELSVSEFVAIISECPITISNDSSPIHIAGAFDGWIGVIATCKHPDYILPFRNGSIYYKAKNLERKPMYYDYDWKPTFIDGFRADLCEDVRLRECLPTPQDIINFVNECLA